MVEFGYLFGWKRCVDLRQLHSNGFSFGKITLNNPAPKQTDCRNSRKKGGIWTRNRNEWNFWHIDHSPEILILSNTVCFSTCTNIHFAVLSDNASKKVSSEIYTKSTKYQTKRVGCIFVWVFLLSTCKKCFCVFFCYLSTPRSVLFFSLWSPFIIKFNQNILPLSICNKKIQCIELRKPCV